MYGACIVRSKNGQTVEIRWSLYIEEVLKCHETRYGTSQLDLILEQRLLTHCTHAGSAPLSAAAKNAVFQAIFFVRNKITNFYTFFYVINYFFPIWLKK